MLIKPDMNYFNPDFSFLLERPLVTTKLSSGKEVNVCFLTINDVAELTHMSKSTVENLFRIPSFPACDFGKSKVVEIHALVYFFMEAKRDMKKWGKNAG